MCFLCKISCKAYKACTKRAKTLFLQVQALQTEGYQSKALDRKTHQRIIFGEASKEGNISFASQNPTTGTFIEYQFSGYVWKDKVRLAMVV
ncbi:hypothetical protein EON73_00710 [bacterium]|nr:MAG: hypothetical protein EON73_00710 [bacterium]